MKTPPLLLGAMLVFWGWQTGFLWIAVPGALVLEGSRLVSWRWALSPSDLSRIVYLCNVLLGGALVYFVVTMDRAHIIDAGMSLMRFIPLALFPLILVQAYSTQDQIDINRLFILFSRKKAQNEARPVRLVNLTYPCFAICLLSAGASNHGTVWFYAAFTLLLSWALWVHRPAAFSPALWLILSVFVWGAGHIGHVGLHRLQGVVENTVSSLYIAAATREEADPYRSKTALGHIGSLKLSGKIILRVKPGKGQKTPFLLHEASYNSYAVSTWFTKTAAARDIRPEAGGTTWKLGPAPGADRSMRIAAYLDDGKGVLPLPLGAFQIEQLPAGGLKQTGLGTVMVDEGPRLTDFVTRFDPQATLLDPPAEADLRVPRNTAPLFSGLVRDLKLKAQSPGHAVQAVARYFEKNFQYSTFQKERDAGTEPLEDFLLKSRSGHCEYFATSTVLLLRAAGIPARYATGYLVTEFSQWENAYVVRSRHAHAWTLVYIDGVWQELDTTPPVWSEAEQQSGQKLRWLTDLWSWAVFQLAQWRVRAEIGKYAGWLLAPLIVILVWRLLRMKRVAVVGKKQKAVRAVSLRPGGDSEFYAIEGKLNERGLNRHPWEPLLEWMGRVQADQRLSLAPEALQNIVSLHYRYRFDPNGISEAERETLRSNVRSLLASAVLRSLRNSH